MKTRQNKNIDLDQINYEEPLARYIDLAYRTLKKSDKKVPAESRMRIPLTVMFIIHNRDVLGYTTVKEFEEVVSKMAGISMNSVRDRVLGGYIGSEYAGLRYIFYKFISYTESRTVSVMWYNRSKKWRYAYMIDVENKLANLMEEEAKKNFEDFSILRIKQQEEETEEDTEE